MTDEEYAHIGKKCREADDGNLLVGSFAAELVGEDYPFSKDMCSIVFDLYTDVTLGKKFVDWTHTRRGKDNG
jgi:hypothetical protein